MSSGNQQSTNSAKGSVRVENVLYDVEIISYIKQTGEFELSSRWLERSENVYVRNFRQVKVKEARPAKVQTIEQIIEKSRKFKRLLRRGKKVYQCVYCQAKTTPGGRTNIMSHLNGVWRKDKKGKKRFQEPCFARRLAEPAVDGVYEKLEPLDVTDAENSLILPDGSNTANESDTASEST